MLTDLHIRNLGIIDDITLDLGAGLNVLTGETGAGKTMVVSAIELLLGSRADTALVRAGAGAARVEARLDPAPPAAAEWLDDAADALVVEREVAAEGRSRARIGGRLAPVSALATVLGDTIEIHGQSSGTRLASSAVQRGLLDRFGGDEVDAALTAYRECWSRLRAVDAELQAAQHDERARLRESDRLTFELQEIDAVAPTAGELDALAAELSRLEHAEQLMTAATSAAGALASEGGGRDALGAASAVLRAATGLDAVLDQLAKRADGLAAEAQELALDLSAYADDLDLDASRLEALRDRQAALERLVRKYGPDLDAVLAYADQARADLDRLMHAADRAATLAAERSGLEEELTSHGQRLSNARRTAGQTLAQAVVAHLDELAMPRASVQVDVEPVAPGPDGADQVTFLLAANPGEALLPLAKAASGGERSRIALAVRLSLTAEDDTAVMVFDEVDAGVGGATALVVGRKLAALAGGRQVLCVTHLAQLAAFADRHFVVEKATADGRTTASVRLLDEASRVPELARMLSGTSSEIAEGHAAELRAMARKGVSSEGAYDP